MLRLRKKTFKNKKFLKNFNIVSMRVIICACNFCKKNIISKQKITPQIFKITIKTTTIHFQNLYKNMVGSLNDGTRNLNFILPLIESIRN